MKVRNAQEQRTLKKKLNGSLKWKIAHKNKIQNGIKVKKKEKHFAATIIILRYNPFARTQLYKCITFINHKIICTLLINTKSPLVSIFTFVHI